MENIISYIQSSNFADSIMAVFVILFASAVINLSKKITKEKNKTFENRDYRQIIEGISLFGLSLIFVMAGLATHMLPQSASLPMSLKYIFMISSSALGVYFTGLLIIDLITKKMKLPENLLDALVGIMGAFYLTEGTILLLC